MGAISFIAGINPAKYTYYKYLKAAFMKILVIEKSSIVEMVIRHELEEFPAELIFASTGEEALNVLKNNPDINVVTLSLNLGDMPGFEVLKACRQRGIGELAKFIVITSDDSAKDRELGFELGVVNFLKKPFCHGELKAVCDRLLMKRACFPDCKILVVEDSEFVQNFLTKFLKSLGSSVSCANDGDDALELAIENEYDLIITDLHMKSKDGDQLCVDLRRIEKYKETPIIVLSSDNRSQTILRLFYNGATEYLTKPFIKEELIARVSVHLENQLNQRKLKERVAFEKTLMRTKDEFLSVCSHDIRSPLSSILGNIELLQEAGNLSKEQHEQLRDVYDSGTYIHDLINNLLDIGKMNAGKYVFKKKVVPVQTLLQSALRIYLKQAQAKNIDLQCKISEANIAALGDKTALQRVVNNLLSNAIKYTHKGSVLIEAYRENKWLCLKVQDTGMGIAPSSIPGLFDRYTSASHEGTAGEESTGLGMSIVKEIVEGHEGCIEVDSTVGQGTSFIVKLPRTEFADSKALEEKHERWQLPQDDLSFLKVLIVDDERSLRRLMSKQLSQMGIKASEACDGLEYLEKVKREPFHIIFCDLEMPKMNGYDATKEIRQFQQEEKSYIVALSGHNQRDLKLDKSIFDLILTKPISKKQCLETIAKIASRFM